jgi:DME family drug/metabolite transporter
MSISHPQSGRGVLLVAVAALLWSTTGIVSRVLFEQTAISPFMVAFIRLVVAAPIFMLLGLALQGRDFLRLPRATGRWLVVLGLAQAGFQTGYLSAVERIGAGLATLITLCLAPVLVALLGALLLGEPLTRRILAAMAIAITGTALLVVSPQAMAISDGLWIGIGCGLLAAAVYAGFTLIGRYAADRVHPMQSAALGFGIGALAMLPILFIEGVTPLMAAADLAIPALAYVALIPTTLGYVCFFSGLQHTTATISSILVLLEPLGAALLAWALLGEALGRFGLAGAIMLTAAVILLTVPGAGRRWLG